MCHSQKEMMVYMHNCNLSPWELFWVEDQFSLHSKKIDLDTQESPISNKFKNPQKHHIYWVRIRLSTFCLNKNFWFQRHPEDSIILVSPYIPPLGSFHVFLHIVENLIRGNFAFIQYR